MSIKYQTEFTDHVQKYKTCAGNGKAVPQTFLDKDGIAKKLLDKDGKQVVHSLYDEIQLNANTNNYKKILESGGDISLFMGTSDQETDLTEIGEASDLLDVQAKLKERGISLSDLSKIVSDLISKQAKAAETAKNPLETAKNPEIKKEKSENK